MFKNVSGQKIAMFAFDYSLGSPKTGDAGNLTPYINIDWAGITALTDTSATEISATNAPGWYLFDVSQSESNGNTLHFTCKSGTSNVAIVGIQLQTVPAALGLAGGASGGFLISGSNSGTTTFGALTVTGATTLTGNVALAAGLDVTQSSLNGNAITLTGNGTGSGIRSVGGSTSGSGLILVGQGTGFGLFSQGSTTGAGASFVAGATGIGVSVTGGSTSGDGIKVTTTSGHGVNLAPVGSSMHGLLSTGGNGGTSDGIKAVAGTGGVDIRGAITGNITGNLSGSAGSVSGNVGGNVVGSVGSVTAAVSLSAGNSPVVQSGTATAGGASTITIQTALGTDNLVKGGKIKITSGTGIGQARGILGYVDSTQVLTVDRAWAVNPDNTSVYTILYDEGPNLDSSLRPTSLVSVGTSAGQINVSSGKVPATLASTDVTGNITADLQTIKTQTVTCAAGVTVNVNVGTTQPVNFTGTAGSALVKSDTVDIAGAAVDVTAAQIGVNIINIKGTGSVGTAGYMGPDWGHVNAPTTTVGLTGTTISTSQVVASVSGAVGSVAGAVASVSGNVGGNVTGSVGSVAAGGIDASSFAADAITATSIAANAITAAKVADGTIDAATFAANAITATVIANNAITDAKIALPTEATGTPSSILQMIMWIAGMLGWRKVIKDSNANTIVEYMSDGTTVKTTSTYTSSGGTDTINKAS